MKDVLANLALLLLFCLLCQLHSSAEQNTRMTKGFSMTRDG